MLSCEMCGKETDITPKYCCNGNDCSCGGVPVNEGLILCSDCKNVLWYIRDINIGNNSFNTGNIVKISLINKRKNENIELYFDQIEE